MVTLFRDKPLDFEPGEKFSYSNSGYVLLTYLIEKITGGSYETFVRENIFTPLGMKDSGYDSNSALLPHRASGYVFSKDRFENAGFVHMSVPQGAGALYSTTEDLLKWEQAFFGGKVLRAASLEKMTTPFKVSYAFGLQVDIVGGRKVIEHGGGIEGFNTQLSYYPEDKLTVVVLGNVNGNAPATIATKLAALSHGESIILPAERKEITLDSRVLSHYVGAYQMGSGVNMLITLEKSQLFSKLGNQQAIPIFPESQTMFFPKVVDAELEFSEEDDQGRPSRLILHQNGHDMPAKRLDEIESKRLVDEAAASAEAIAKRFKEQEPAPGSEAALRRSIEELRLGQPDYSRMGPEIANVTRQQLPMLTSTIKQLGTVQSVKFTGVGPGGRDIYEVRFENGLTEFRIAMTADGKIDGIGLRLQGAAVQK
ncbi:MAG: serine hydrolase [Bryobacteraceae bacterium]